MVTTQYRIEKGQDTMSKVALVTGTSTGVGVIPPESSRGFK